MLKIGSADLQTVLSWPVDELRLSVRAKNCFDEAGICTIRDLVVKSGSELLGMRKFGKTTLNEVNRKLEELGLWLGMFLGSEERPSWDVYSLMIAGVVATRSPDPDTKHGCVLVDPEHRIVSTGYNGPVAGLPNGAVPVSRPEKYAWMIHAEDNAVMFARQILAGATAYVTGAPCPACLRRLLQVGVRRIVHGPRRSACINEEDQSASLRMAELVGAVVVEVSP